MDISELSESTVKLIAAAENVKEKAYAKYSKLSVGAAVLSTSGDIYVGCNVENISYGLTCCAERSAIFSAVSTEGADFRMKAFAVFASLDGNHFPISPCGACRQVLAEFAENDAVGFFAGSDGKLCQVKVAELLPHVFSKIREN
jgi:cytidine deaminase